MTKRELYLKAMRNEQVDDIVWAPNFDYWLHVSQAEGTLPQKYLGMSRNDIVRAVGGSIWNRAEGMRAVYDSSVKDIWRKSGTDTIHEIETPIGTIREVSKQTEGKHRSTAITEHLVKDLETLQIMKYVIEATHFEPNYSPTQKALDETGDDGVVLNSCFCVPFIQFAKMDAGYVNGFYMWMDHREEVDSLLSLYQEKYLEGYKIVANGPADVIASGDNMDGVMISPDIFKEYAIPFYLEAKKICSDHDKIFEAHWCGRTQNLLDLVPDCGLDVVEAIVTKPMADITLEDAIDKLRGEVVLQGGIPSVLICNEGGSTEDFEKYIEEVILPLKGRKGFILGMSDNVPPNADFERVERIAELVKG